MNSQDIQKHIDRAVGTEGTLRIPAWWMHKILSDLVQYCDSLKSSDNTIKDYIEDQLNLIGEAVEVLDARLSTVESHELFAIVSELPSKPKANTIYLIPSVNGDGNNILTEWVYINGAWEQFGEFKADVDLSGYVTTSAFNSNMVGLGTQLGNLDSAIKELANQHSLDISITAQRLYDKQDKEEGKGLSTNDYTTEEKEKLASLENYDDTEITEKLTELSEANEVLKEAQQFTDVAIKDLQDMKIDRENDDYYPKMAVGLADNLAGVDVVDSEINFRRSGGGAITDGVARIESIKGNSVVWNQKWSLGVRQGVIDNTDGASPKYASLGVIPWYTTAINGHKILTIANDKEGIIDRVYWNDQVQNDVLGGTIYEAKTNQTTRSSLTARCPANTIANYDVTIQLYDLTLMFGAGNEPTTIEEFYQRIPMGVDLNAYNEGEVIHMDVQSVESQGVNQWDEEWEKGKFSTTDGTNQAADGTMRMVNKVAVLPNSAYYFKSPVDTWVLFYDKDGKVIEGYSTGISSYQNACNVKNVTFTTPSNAASMRAYFNMYFVSVVGYQNDICINISNADINGKYFPYIKRVEDLSLIRKYFPDGMKSAGSAHDEIRYNKATQKWEKVEVIGTRAYQEGDEEDASLLTDKTTTCYPLAEPIVTELDEADQYKDLDYQVWNCGTEKAIAEGKSSPLAADITYGFNAIGKIKELDSLVAALRAKVGI